jgi:hypothetical protein
VVVGVGQTIVNRARHADGNIDIGSAPNSVATNARTGGVLPGAVAW